MNKIEILSPARNMDAVIAAVRSGCDAVYVGAKNFSARMSADNFTIEELDDCIKYCHQRDVKVYLAVNTLIFDEEMKEALSLVKEAANIDIDAIIVQDIGFASLVHRMTPNLRLHASTQMSVHTPNGAKALYNLGFSRVVLSRELSKEEIIDIHNECKEIELEVFVHGALCMCVSGQCFMSAFLGGRSANRGMCAQPCRLGYKINGQSVNALSLKDNSIIERLHELEEIGVTSAKIEGRMKRPEYVSSVTRACKEIRDNGKIDEKTKEHVEGVFSRTGFTSGYYDNKRGKDMFGYRTKDDVVSASSSLLKEIRNSYKDEYKKIGFSCVFTAHIDENPKLQIILDDKTVEIKSDTVVEKAINKATTKEILIENLSKTGGTQYFVNDIKLEIDDNISLPLSVINNMRREGIKEIDKLKEKTHEYIIEEDIDKLLHLDKVEAKEKEIKKRAIVRDLNIDGSFSSFDIVFVDLFKLNDFEKYQGKINLGAEIPRTLFSDENRAKKKLEEIKDKGIKDVLVHNIGSLYLAKEMGFNVHTGFGLNIANSFSLKFLKDLGVVTAEASIELTTKQIKSLNKCIKTGMCVYGHIPLMITRNCPNKSVGNDCKSCKKDVILQDRKDEELRVICNNGVSEIFNPVPLILSSKIYNEAEPDFVTLSLLVEKSVENKEKAVEKMSKNLGVGRYTHGLSTKGVNKLTYF